MHRRNLNAISAGVWLALVLALAGSLRHVAWAFSTLEHGDMTAGYIQAIAVDVGLMMLALGIQQRRRQRRRTTVLWIGVTLFSAIRIYANFLFGLVHQQDIQAGPLASWRPVLLSAGLPLLVLYLSEVAGSDVSYNVQMHEREQRRRTKKLSAIESGNAFPMPIEQTRSIRAEQREHSKEEALEAMLNIWREQPDARVVDVARRIGRSRSTIYTYLAELEQTGRAVRDDGVVHVLAETGPSFD
jgi:hypothetical protein